MREKPTCRLEDWFQIGDRMYGKLYGHPNHQPGTEIKSSNIIGETIGKEHIIETKFWLIILGKKRQPTKEEMELA